MNTPAKSANPEISAQTKLFRQELEKAMPGYQWTVHNSRTEGRLEATGAQSKGFNRLSTLSVVRTEHRGTVWYVAKSSGYGLRAPWLHEHGDGTLARALRGLQTHYEDMAQKYRIHASDLEQARPAKPANAHKNDDERLKAAQTASVVAAVAKPPRTTRAMVDGVFGSTAGTRIF